VHVATSVLVLGLAIAAAEADAAFAQLRDRLPTPGDLLIASRRLDDAIFGETVVLLLAYGPDGAQGIVINRRTLVRISTALPNLEALADRPDTLYWGGPVEPDKAVMLTRGDAPPPTGQPLLGDVWVVRKRDAIESLLTRGSSDATMRLYGGYAGWSPGQLESEIATGAWYLRPADADRLFAEDTDGLWKTLSTLASAPVV
jgi:putative transcriptional regulator